VILVLHPDQVWDRNRGAFLVHIKATNKKHLGERVYTDAFGREFVVIPREETA
jgi:hypothetical protein